MLVTPHTFSVSDEKSWLRLELGKWLEVLQNIPLNLVNKPDQTGAWNWICDCLINGFVWTALCNLHPPLIVWISVCCVYYNNSLCTEQSCNVPWFFLQDEQNQEPFGACLIPKVKPLSRHCWFSQSITRPALLFWHAQTFSLSLSVLSMLYCSLQVIISGAQYSQKKMS